MNQWTFWISQDQKGFSSLRPKVQAITVKHWNEESETFGSNPAGTNKFTANAFKKQVLRTERNSF